ncbi:thermostable hemolysin [Paucibacter sp. M5-1]|uniref:thermostable hemolysin n=1 Tax=Paucibacter sp. M5-1 TaxID=3015998 RepID=UPI0022B8D5FF|nr:thermostable hemolysin [Paucibacter sp. M5-1]MCZ7880639.1 thermostable hemolysin [Paucibacter sp. M5-1]
MLSAACCFSPPCSDTRTSVAAPLAAGSRLRLHRPGEPGRKAVEAFIAAIYAQRFGATLRQFAPLLLSLCDESGEHIVAAAGYRPASETLFLERYLAAPIEQLLARQAGAATPARGRIVEVGHLAAARSGEGRRLIMLMGPHLAEQGFEWVVSTLTTELRHLFLRIGVTPLALGLADPAVLEPDEARLWGSYYEHRPVVLAGHLPQALQQLARRRADRAARQAS